MSKTHAWNRVPLGDYERHMQHENVAQAKLLNSLTNKYLQKHNPEHVLFLGISGGNGLEHIDINRTKMIYGIDVNQSYLDETKKRFGEKIKQLVLVATDIASSNQSFIKADFVWAALIFEYINIQKGFEFIANNIGESTNLIVTIQANNGNQSVSETGIGSIKALKDIFEIVDKDSLQLNAAKIGFKLIGSEENIMPNGKSFLTYEFSKCKNI
jgi:hypothetical protein